MYNSCIFIVVYYLYTRRILAAYPLHTSNIVAQFCSVGHATPRISWVSASMYPRGGGCEQMYYIFKATLPAAGAPPPSWLADRLSLVRLLPQLVRLIASSCSGGLLPAGMEHCFHLVQILVPAGADLCSFLLFPSPSHLPTPRHGSIQHS